MCCRKQPSSHLLASLLSPRDLSSLKQHMTATGTVMRDRPTSSTILQSGTCNSQSHVSPQQELNKKRMAATFPQILPVILNPSPSHFVKVHGRNFSAYRRTMNGELTLH